MWDDTADMPFEQRFIAHRTVPVGPAALEWEQTPPPRGGTEPAETRQSGAAPPYCSSLQRRTQGVAVGCPRVRPGRRGLAARTPARGPGCLALA